MSRLAWPLIVCLLFAAGCDVLDKQAANEYEAATKKWNAGEYQAAVALYTELVRQHPYSPYADNALYWVGVTQFLYLDETSKALRTLELVIKRYPNRDMAPAAQFYIAQIYELGYNDYGRAVEEFRKASESSDRDVREKSLYCLADNLFRLGSIEEARKTWSRQISEFPKGPQSSLAYFRLGTAAFSKGDIRGAETFYRKALENGSDRELSVKSTFALAGCLEADDNLREALKLYRQIEPVYPNPEAIQIKIKAIETRILKKSY